MVTRRRDLVTPNEYLPVPVALPLFATVLVGGRLVGAKGQASRLASSLLAHAHLRARRDEKKAPVHLTGACCAARTFGLAATHFQSYFVSQTLMVRIALCASASVA